MYIKRIELRSIRALGTDKRLVLDLEPLDGRLAGWHVVVGRNGCGKSTLLKAIALACVGPDVGTILQRPRSWWLTRGARSGSVEVTVVKGAEDAWKPADGDGVGSGGRQTFTLKVVAKPKALEGASPATSRADRGPWIKEDQPPGWFVAGYGPYRRLAGDHLPRTSTEDMTRPEDQLRSLFDDGGGLIHPISWIKQIKLDDPDGSLLSMLLSLISDGLLPGQAKAVSVNGSGLEVCELGQTLPVTALSDGYQTTVALVVDLVRQLQFAHTPVKFARRGTRTVVENEGVVLIDEIEAHIHPDWQRRIGLWFVEHFPNMQFIVTTHSPFVVQSATSGCVIRLARPDEAVDSRVYSGEALEAVIAGTADDVYLSSLFGVETTRSAYGEKLIEEASALETRVLAGDATKLEIERYRRLKSMLPATAELVAALRSLESRL